jgi:hypothetical protein
LFYKNQGCGLGFKNKKYKHPPKLILTNKVQNLYRFII